MLKIDKIAYDLLLDQIEDATTHEQLHEIACQVDAVSREFLLLDLYVRRAENIYREQWDKITARHFLERHAANGER